MTSHEIFTRLSEVSHQWWISAFATTIFFYALCQITYRLSPLHPLSGIPGPFLARITDLNLVYHAYHGDEAQYVHLLHQRYGPVVRIAYDSVDFTNVSALEGIYLKKGGFLKPRYYNNFDVDGHASIFSNTDLTQRGARAKAVLPLFSISRVKEGSRSFDQSRSRFLTKLREQKALGRANVLDLARGMSIDAVTEYLFGVRYGALQDQEEKHSSHSKGSGTQRMAASTVVDNFVLTSRFWYLPTWLYDLADRVDAFFYPNPTVAPSTDILNEYADSVISHAVQLLGSQDADGGSNETLANYPMRLLKAGFSRSEARAQCKDIIYAATDTIGMNLATVCFMLAKYPQVYEKLHQEVIHANIAHVDHIQNLPYLILVVREALRLSMTNPCRLPRAVPTGGWTYGGRFYPKGMIVSCSANEMHLSPEVFPEPLEFRPERWETATDAMKKSHMAFGLGGRHCIAKALSLLELHRVVYEIVREDILRDARPATETISILEGFTAKVIGGDVGLIWDTR